MYAYEKPDGPADRNRHPRPPTVTPHAPASLVVPPGLPAAATAARLVALQRAAGNTAIARLLGGSGPAERATDRATPDRPLAVQRANSYTDEAATISHYEPKIPTNSAPYHARDLVVRRPRQVAGTVSPTGTKGRPDAPAPWAMVQLAEAYRAARINAEQTSGKHYPHISVGDVWRDLLAGAGADRGHIMGLELGGDDISENIVPQWSFNQQSGPWRKHEKALRASKGATVEFTVNYASDQGSWRKAIIPRSIEYSVVGGPVTTWENAPDDNDLFRSGASPDDHNKALFEFVRTQAPPGTVCTEAKMDEYAFKALADAMARHQDHEAYVKARKANVKPVSQYDARLARITKSHIEKRKRTSLIKKLEASGRIVKKNNKYEIR
ncbi:hypothetical protein GCM10027280_27450 [Micromonospora polyrhachis]